MLKHFRATLALLLLSGCGGGLEGDLTEAEETAGRWSPELTKRLCENAADPRVKEHLGKYVRGVAARANPGDTPDEVVRLIGQALEKDPLPATPLNAEAIVELIRNEVASSARKWIKDYETSPKVTKAIAKRIETITFRKSQKPPPADLNRLTSELEGRKTPLDSELLTLLVNVAIGVPLSAAGAYLEKGFPADGAPLGTDERIPPAGDPRIRAAIMEGLKYLDRPYRAPDKETVRALEVAVRVHIRRSSSEDADRFISAMLPLGQANERFLDMLPILVATAEDAGERVHRIAGTLNAGTVKSYALRAAQRLGHGNVDPGTLVLQDYLALLGRARNGSDRIQAGRKAEKQLIALEEKAEPALKLLLNNKSADARSVAVRAWSMVDPGDLAAELNRKMGSPSRVNWDMANEALPLISEARGPEVDEFLLRCLSLGGGPGTKSAQILRKRLDADQFTAGLFGLLIRKKTFGGSEVNTYLETLSSYAGSGAAVVKHLTRHVEASGGRPEKVFWMVKYLSLRILATRGDSSAKPILEKLKADSSQFTWTSMKTDPQTGAIISEEKKVINFSDEASAALEAIVGQDP